jgi:hypothetical protein
MGGKVWHQFDVACAKYGTFSLAETQRFGPPDIVQNMRAFSSCDMSPRSEVAWEEWEEKNLLPWLDAHRALPMLKRSGINSTLLAQNMVLFPSQRLNASVHLILFLLGRP